MSLTDVKIRNAKPHSGKAIRLHDDRGMYLEIAPSGGRWWRLKYRFGGKEKRISLGTFPEVGLKDARTRCDEARKLLSSGVDPSRQPKAAKLVRAESEDTFEKIGRQWYGKRAEIWDPAHAARVLSRLERDIFPFIGGHSIAAIEAPELLTVLQRSRSARDCSAGAGRL